MSAATVSGASITFGFQANLAQLVPPPTQNKSTIVQNLQISPATGNGIGGWDRIYSAAFTVTHGTPLVINLTSGLDPLQNVLGMIHVMAITLFNGSTISGQDMSMGGGTHPVSGDIQTAYANSGAQQSNYGTTGIVIASGVNDQITITVAAGTAVPGQISIAGRSA